MLSVTTDGHQVSEEDWRGSMTIQQEGIQHMYEQFRIGHYYKVATLLTAKNSSISSRRDTPKFQPVLSSQPKSAPHEVTIPCENLIDDGCQLLTIWNKFQPWRTLFTRSRSDHNAHPPGICSNSYNNLTHNKNNHR